MSWLLAFSPVAVMVCPVHRSNSPFANRKRSVFLSKLPRTKEHEEDSHGKCLELEDGRNRRAVKQGTSM